MANFITKAFSNFNNQNLPHSKVGLVSFSIAMVSIFLFAVLFVIAGREGIPDIVGNSLFYISMSGSILASILGIIGWNKKDTNTLYSILGFFLGVGLLLFVFALIVMYSMNQKEDA
jgi:hypothetical protein